MPSSPVTGARPSAEGDFSDKSTNEAGPSRGRLLLLIPTTSYKAHDFLAAAERLGVEVAVGSDRRQILEAYSEGLTTTIDFKRRDPGRGATGWRPRES